MSYTFLSYQTIQSDLERFSKSLSEKLGLTVNPLMNEMDESPEQEVGYEMKSQDDFYVVTRSYLRNNRVEYAVKDRDSHWNVNHNGTRVIGDFPTLQEVIDYIKSVEEK